MELANNVGLEAEYVSRIQSGSLDIKTITDDALKQHIRDYKEWYEKVLKDAVKQTKTKSGQQGIS